MTEQSVTRQAAIKNQIIIIPVLYTASGIMLVAGNVLPKLGVLFYPGIALASFLIMKQYITRLGIYCLLAPYFLMLGFCVWNYIFPYYTGVILAVLLGDLFGRVLYRILTCSMGTFFDFMTFPVFLFLFDFIFQNIPVLSFIHMIPILSPVALHYLIIKAASIVGGHLVLASITLLISSLIKIVAGHKQLKAPIIIFATCCILFIIPNTLMLIEPPQKKRNIRTISAAVVQGSYKPSSSNMEYEDYIEDKTGYYMELAKNGAADIIVFPETEFGAYDIKNEIDKQYRERIIRASKQLGGIAVFTVIEGNSATKSKEERFITALLVEDGEIIGINRKRNLVPFSETKSYSGGEKYDTCDVSLGRIGVSICYDINAKTIERLKENGAQLIATPFNDGGFGVVYHNIHRYYPVIKAAECTVPIAAANEDGISQIVDHNGKVLAELGYGKKGRLEYFIDIKERNSIYLLFGRYIEWILFFGLAGCFIIMGIFNFKIKKA